MPHSVPHAVRWPWNSTLKTVRSLVPSKRCCADRRWQQLPSRRSATGPSMPKASATGHRLDTLDGRVRPAAGTPLLRRRSAADTDALLGVVTDPRLCHGHFFLLAGMATRHAVFLTSRSSAGSLRSVFRRRPTVGSRGSWDYDSCTCSCGVPMEFPKNRRIKGRPHPREDRCRSCCSGSSLRPKQPLDRAEYCTQVRRHLGLGYLCPAGAEGAVCP